MNADNLRLVGHNKMARQITLQLNKEGGYSRPVSEVVLQINDPFSVNKTGTLKHVNNLNPNHPEWLIVPTAQEIADGKIFTVDSNKLGISGYNEPYLSFRDGVLNLDLYVGLQTVSVTGAEGTDYLIGTGLNLLLEAYDSVIIGQEVYQLRKDMPTNGGTVVYLDKELKEDTSEVVFAERNNLKIFNDFRTKCIIGKSAYILLNTKRVPEKEQAILKVVRNKVVAEVAFEQTDYLLADRLLRENVDIGNYLRVLRGGEIW